MSEWHIVNHLLTFHRALLMLSCATRNQIFRCSLLPLSLMCECWIAKFTARYPLWRGTQESTAVNALTPVRGDKCLSFRKVYPRTRINSGERIRACVLVQQVSLRLTQRHFIFTYSSMSLWVTVLQSRAFHSGAVSRGVFVYLEHTIQICRRWDDITHVAVPQWRVQD